MDTARCHRTDRGQTDWAAMLRRVFKATAFCSPCVQGSSLHGRSYRLLSSLSVNNEGPGESDLHEARQWLDAFDAESLPKSICDISFSRSSGPGGQNVNKCEYFLQCPLVRETESVVSLQGEFQGHPALAIGLTASSPTRSAASTDPNVSLPRRQNKCIDYTIRWQSETRRQCQAMLSEAS